MHETLTQKISQKYLNNKYKFLKRITVISFFGKITVKNYLNNNGQKYWNNNGQKIFE